MKVLWKEGREHQQEHHKFLPLVEEQKQKETHFNSDIMFLF